MGSAETAPLPAGYYRALYEAEERHWWHRGMREITRALVGERVTSRGVRVLDAGCGTGGFLAWLQTVTDSARLAGVDVSEEALALAQSRAPGAELLEAPVSRLPFEDGSFDLVFLNDVLQHLHEEDEAGSLAELRRVLDPSGALLVRTGGSRRARRLSPAWRTYDGATLTSALHQAGLRADRLTYANVLGSMWAVAQGRTPTEPTETSHGVPAQSGESLATSVKYRLLLLEARFLRDSRRVLPWGHTLYAVAVAKPQ